MKPIMFNDKHQEFVDEITTRIRKARAGSYRINVVRDKTAIPFDFFIYHCFLNSKGESINDKDSMYPLYLELYNYDNKEHKRVYVGQYYDTKTIIDELVQKHYDKPKVVAALLQAQKEFGFTIHSI